jgi:riboflavin synthase
MFTGIIKAKGKISKINKSKNQTTIEVETGKNFKLGKIGSSIAVNGICLTVTKIEKNKTRKNILHFDVMAETLSKTNLKNLNGNLDENIEVNLEPALTFGQKLDGHFVQGHIDATGKILEIKKGKSQTKLKISYPKAFKKFLILKGSIAVNGVSLTISNLGKDNFEVCLVKHTLENTNLSNLKKNSKVNLEFDLLSKYLNSFNADKKHKK